MGKKRALYLMYKNSLFWLSRRLDFPFFAPDVLQVNFTFRCNLRCRMCSMHERIESLKSQGKPHELEVSTIKKVIKEARDMGIRSTIFIGGEPFLEPRLFELISFANDCGMEGVTVVTNGTLFSDAIIDNIFDSKLGCLSISIDSASEDVFARIRGERYLHRIMENIDRINRRKEQRKTSSPHIVSVCTVMDQNLEGLMNVVDLCRRLRLSKLIFQPVVGDNTDQARNDLSSSVFIPEERYALLDNMIDRIIRYKLSNKEDFDFIANSVTQLRLMKKYFRGQLKPQEIPCYAGYNRLQVVQEGKVYFCVSQDNHEATFGDVSSDSLKELWFSKEARESRKIMRRCKSPCLQWCAYRDEFVELAQMWRKAFIFKKKNNDYRVSDVESNSGLYGFKLYEPWHSEFPTENIPLLSSSQTVMHPEPRIEELAARMKVQGSRVLELGCMEGAHSFMLHSMGAKEIIAIEGRESNFLKCLAVKNAFSLDRCKFILGDLEKILPMLPGGFDICLASGILYHLQDPVSAIFKIAELAGSLFVWSHYASEEFPEGHSDEIEYRGHMYLGKRVGEDPGHYTSGLQVTSFWLFEQEMMKAVKDAGFKDIEVISKEKHEHGPAIMFFAKK